MITIDANKQKNMAAVPPLLKTNISPGSVATRFRCGGIFNDYFVANLALNVLLNKFKNRSIINDNMDN